jgi:hypothetical protein
LIQSKKTPFKSKNQRVLYELIQENPNIVTTYNDLHAMTAIPKTTIRDALRLFERKGLILKNKYVSSDGFQGLHIKLRHTIPTHHPDTPSRVSRSTDESSSKIDRFYLSSGRGGSTEGGVQEGGFQSDSSAEKLTSLSNADIQFHWPCLAGTGFGVHQIQQIVERLQKVEKPLTYIFQSLDHIEFELENGQLQDRNGSSVQDPCSYAFNALAKHGYYRRPHGYISSQEQAEEDARLEAEQLRKAREKKEEEEFQAWKQSLSEEEYRELIKDKKGPEEKWLKHKWREKKKF